MSSQYIRPNYFKLHLLILGAFGVDIMEIKSRWLRPIYRIVTTILMTLLTYVYAATEGIDLFDGVSDIRKITFGSAFFVQHFLGTIKITILMIQRKTFRNLLAKLEQGVFKPNFSRCGQIEFDLIKNANFKCNLQGIIFYTLVVIICSIRLIYAATDSGTEVEIIDYALNISRFSHKASMPFPSWFPFNNNIQPYYAVGSIYQVSSACLFGLYIGANDAVICGCMIHIKVQFIILRKSLENVIERAIKNIYPDGDETEMYNKLYDKVYLPCGINNGKMLCKPIQDEIEQLVIDSVKHHQKLIKFCDDIEQAFNYLMLLQFLSSVVVLCSQLFQLSVTDPTSVEFASVTIYLILMLYQILCYCMHGNEVMLISSLLPTYIFQTDWIMFNDRTKKSLLLMMMRSQRPVTFTAGKFALLSLETFMTIVRGSGSYFMVLRKMNN